VLYWLRRWIFLANHIDCTAGISDGTKCVTLCDDIDEPRGFEFLHLYFEKVLIALGQLVDRHAGVMSLNVSDFVPLTRQTELGLFNAKFITNCRKDVANRHSTLSVRVCRIISWSRAQPIRVADRRSDSPLLPMQLNQNNLG